MIKQIKVLYFVDRLLIGGIQSFILNNIKHFNRDKVIIDFLVLDDGNTYDAEDELKEQNYNIYKLKGVWLRKPKDFVHYSKEVDKFFAEHHGYDVVHMHSSSKNYMILKAAKKYGIPVRIAHSHSIKFQSQSKMQNLFGSMLKVPLNYYATHYFACSNAAGEWLFGKRIAKEKLIVINNAVDIQIFKHSAEYAEKMKNKLGLSGSFVIGHVGRFTPEKNHEFLLDVFQSVLSLKPNSKLLLIGTGDLVSQIKSKAELLRIQDKIIFAGFHTDVNNYMQAMDVFVFPSKFEGLGLVLIEAQAAGLPCFTSADVVPNEAAVSDLLRFISLEKSPAEWADIILNSNLERQDKYNTIKSGGYSIKDTAKELESFYYNIDIISKSGYKVSDSAKSSSVKETSQ